MKHEATWQATLALAPVVLPSPELTRELKRWIDEEDSSHRWEAAAVLRKAGQKIPEADLYLRDLSDDSCPVRRDAALYFSEHPTQKAHKALQDAYTRSVTRQKGKLPFLKGKQEPHCDHEVLRKALDTLEATAKR